MNIHFLTKHFLMDEMNMNLDLFSFSMKIGLKTNALAPTLITLH